MNYATKLVLTILLAGAHLASADLILRDKINSVTTSSSVSEADRPMKEGEAPAQVIRTGPDSRAEFVFAGGLIRLGADSAVSLDAASRSMTLRAGSVLFQNLAGDRHLTIKLPGHEVVLTGDTGFVNLLPGGEKGTFFVCVGAMAGSTTVKFDGRKRALDAADLLLINDQGKLLNTSFNLPQVLKTSSLVRGFAAPLPNAADLEKEAQRYASLEARGFIRPVKSASGAHRESPSALATGVTFERNKSMAQKADGEVGNLAASTSPRDWITGGGKMRFEQAGSFGLVENFAAQSSTSLGLVMTLNGRPNGRALPPAPPSPGGQPR